jgi:GTP 3',8-cyclase
MLDSYSRKIDYLRISVTDRCNLRCRYCMPEQGVQLLKHEQILSFDEIAHAAKIAARMGVAKIRLTGGEPLVRKDIVSLVKMIAQIKEIDDIGLTTNGVLLNEFAQELKKAGLKRVNISLDTLDPERYKHLTRGGDIAKVFAGIEAAKSVGFSPIKINVVVFDKEDITTKLQLTRFCKDNNLNIRFIQKMDLDSGDFSIVEGGTGGDCRICNRLRLTANGFIKPCLFSEIGFSVRELGVEEAIKRAVEHKPKQGSVCHNHQFFNIGG